MFKMRSTFHDASKRPFNHEKASRRTRVYQFDERYIIFYCFTTLQVFDILSEHEAGISRSVAFRSSNGPLRSTATLRKNCLILAQAQSMMRPISATYHLIQGTEGRGLTNSSTALGSSPSQRPEGTYSPSPSHSSQSSSHLPH